MTFKQPAALPLAPRLDVDAASPRFFAVARRDALPSGRAMEVVAAGITLAVFNVDGHVHAVENCCVGCGSALAQGTMEQSTVACPGCGWRYDLVTGALVALPEIRIDTFVVRIDERREMLEIALPVPVQRHLVS